MPNQFAFVPARDLDPDALRDFAAAVWGEASHGDVTDRWWLQSDYATTSAAIAADGTVAGICVGIPSQWQLPDRGPTQVISICSWYVAPQFSGRGLGKSLVQSFARQASGLNTLSISEPAIRNFAKLGWVGPFHAHLRLLPLPGLRRAGPLRSGTFDIWSSQATSQGFGDELAEALDAIDAGKPETQLRRRRQAADWRHHLSVRPKRRLRFHVIRSRGEPVGYFVTRPSDEEAGALYRRARVHYVSDFIVNSYAPELLAFAFAAMPRFAGTAGALVLCSSSPEIARAASEAGWMDERSALLGSRIASKAPAFMLAGDLARFAGGDIHLTFADSDVDLNI